MSFEDLGVFLSYSSDNSPTVESEEMSSAVSMSTEDRSDKPIGVEFGAEVADRKSTNGH